MILTCPDCATRYFVDDAKLGGAGKTVRCAACGTRWTARAEPEAELELTNIPEIGTVAAEPALAPAEEVRPFPEALPKAYRAKVEAYEIPYLQQKQSAARLDRDILRNDPVDNPLKNDPAAQRQDLNGSSPTAPPR